MAHAETSGSTKSVERITISGQDILIFTLAISVIGSFDGSIAKLQYGLGNYENNFLPGLSRIIHYPPGADGLHEVISFSVEVTESKPPFEFNFNCTYSGAPPQFNCSLTVVCLHGSASLQTGTSPPQSSSNQDQVLHLDAPNENVTSTYLERQSMRSFLPQKYRQLHELGRGQFGVVFAAVNEITNEKVAIKRVLKEALNLEDEEGLKLEAEILISFAHENIVKCYDIIEDLKSYSVVLEIVEGGELFDRIIAKHTYTENDARAVIASLLSAVKHCHEHDVVHRYFQSHY